MSILKIGHSSLECGRDQNIQLRKEVKKLEERKKDLLALYSGVLQFFYLSFTQKEHPLNAAFFESCYHITWTMREFISARNKVIEFRDKRLKGLVILKSSKDEVEKFLDEFQTIKESPIILDGDSIHFHNAAVVFSSLSRFLNLCLPIFNILSRNLREEVDIDNLLGLYMLKKLNLKVQWLTSVFKVISAAL